MATEHVLLYMPCYCMPCYDVLCRVALCCALLSCPVLSCPMLLCYDMICYDVLQHTMLCHAIILNAILCHWILCYPFAPPGDTVLCRGIQCAGTGATRRRRASTCVHVPIPWQNSQQKMSGTLRIVLFREVYKRKALRLLTERVK